MLAEIPDPREGTRGWLLDNYIAVLVIIGAICIAAIAIGVAQAVRARRRRAAQQDAPLS